MRNTLKKIINTKTGGLIFQVILGPPLLLFCMIGGTALWLGAKK